MSGGSVWTARSAYPWARLRGPTCALGGRRPLRPRRAICQGDRVGGWWTLLSAAVRLELPAELPPNERRGRMVTWQTYS